MPRETRQILFDKDEVVTALVDYSKATAGRLPPGRIESCQLRPGDPVDAVLLIRDLDETGYSRVRFDASQVAAALITLCRKLRVPVPKRSTKSLEVVRDRLCLTFKMHTPVDKQAA